MNNMLEVQVPGGSGERGISEDYNRQADHHTPLCTHSMPLRMSRMYGRATRGSNGSLYSSSVITGPFSTNSCTRYTQSPLTSWMTSTRLAMLRCFSCFMTMTSFKISSSVRPRRRRFKRFLSIFCVH